MHAARDMAMPYAQRLRVQGLEEALQNIRRVRPELLRDPAEPLQQDRGEPGVDLLMDDI